MKRRCSYGYSDAIAKVPVFLRVHKAMTTVKLRASRRRLELTELEVEIVRQSRGIWKFHAKAMVDQQLAVEAELMCTMRSISEPEPVVSA